MYQQPQGLDLHGKAWDSPKALFPRRSSSGAVSQSEMIAEDLVEIAAENYVEAADLSEMIARGTRECEE